MLRWMFIIIALVFTVTKWAQASEVDQPLPYMRDGVITVTLKDGKVYTFSLNEYKIVRRGTSAPAIVKEVPVVTILQAVAVEESKTRFTLHGGYGPNGLKPRMLAPGVVEVTTTRGFLFGGTYSHKFTRELSWSFTGLSNGTGLLGVGYDF